MNNSVNPYRHGRAAYAQQHAHAPQKASRPAAPAQSDAATSAQAAEQARPTASSAPTKAAEGDLTAQEQQMIDQHFPEKPELAMRLYGPGRNTQTVNPGAVGSRLDVRG